MTCARRWRRAWASGFAPRLGIARCRAWGTGTAAPATTCATARTRRRSRRPRRSWRGCKKSAGALGGVRLVSADEGEVHRHPRRAKVWPRRGRPLRVPAAGDARKFAVFGALDDASGRLVSRVADRKDGAAFVAFLDDLAAAFPDGPMVVVLDNVGYHYHKGRPAKDWWTAHQDRVRPLWLPAYAPELNLIERVWRHRKDSLSCHRWWADRPAVPEATAVLLARIEARFHRPVPGSIALVQTF